MNRLFLCNRTATIWILLVGLAVAVSTISAQASPRSDPVGVLRLKLRGNSDTIVSLPLHRPTIVEARISERNGATLTLDTTVPSLPSEGAYALVMSGALEGAVLPVMSKSGDTLTVDAPDYDLSTLATGADGNLVELIPFWTLASLFPDGLGIKGSSNAMSPLTEILLFDHRSVGKNQAPTSSYYYYTGAALLGPGWYKVGVPDELADTTVLVPYCHFIIRHNTATNTDLFISGAVQLSQYRIPLATRAANLDQDNFVAWPTPLPATLSQSTLVSSGAFSVTTNPFSPTDQLLRFDATTIGKNKAPTLTYYYYEGAALEGSGWYKVGSTNRVDGDILAPGEAVIVRKKRSPSPAAKSWFGLPSYLQ